jgi:type II secretory pathway component PulJ
MSARSGFTLLDLIVSIAVTGIIALLVYASAAAGFDTRDALARHRDGAESELRVRALLVDALRHASDDADPGQPAFEIVDAIDSHGLPADQLTFLTRGVVPPLGASALWRVTIAATPTGLVLNASLVDADANASPAVVATMGDVRGLDVEAMPLAERTWATAWASTQQLPAAARLTLYDATGRAVGAPVVARIGLEAVR